LYDGAEGGVLGRAEPGDSDLINVSIAAFERMNLRRTSCQTYPRESTKPLPLALNRQPAF
jgi:hypothetical protein